MTAPFLFHLLYFHIKLGIYSFWQQFLTTYLYTLWGIYFQSFNYSNSLFLWKDRSQNPSWIPETVDSTEPYTHSTLSLYFTYHNLLCVLFTDFVCHSHKTVCPVSAEDFARKTLYTKSSLPWLTHNRSSINICQMSDCHQRLLSFDWDIKTKLAMYLYIPNLPCSKATFHVQDPS